MSVCVVVASNMGFSCPCDVYCAPPILLMMEILHDLVYHNMPKP